MKNTFMLTSQQVSDSLNTIIQKELTPQKQFTYMVSANFADIKKSNAKYMLFLQNLENGYQIQIFTQSLYGTLPVLLFSTGIWPNLQDMLNQLKEERLTRLNPCARDICKHYESFTEVLEKIEIKEEHSVWNSLTNVFNLMDRLSGKTVASIKSDPLCSIQNLINKVPASKKETVKIKSELNASLNKLSQKVKSTENFMIKHEIEHIFTALSNLPFQNDYMNTEAA